VIAYKLKITQDGLLSFSYSYNGAPISPCSPAGHHEHRTARWPGSFRFGFRGLDGR